MPVRATKAGWLLKSSRRQLAECQKGTRNIKSFIFSLWDRTSHSFWFLPALMVISTFWLASGMLALDQSQLFGFGPDQTGIWLYNGGAAQASSVLSTIAASMMTITGVVFSMTLVAMTLASSQFGPRLLRNFMGDTSNQVVLGTFLATFLYCLLILANIRRGVEGQFVPQISITAAMLFSIIDIGVLIYFIHHVSVSIQADAIVARIGYEMVAAIERLVPAQPKQDGSTNSGDTQTEQQNQPEPRKRCEVAALMDGYLQYIDSDSLRRLATDEDLELHVQHRTGQFITKGSIVVQVYNRAEQEPELAKRICSDFSLGFQPVAAQDVAFCIRQLVEVAVRSLSPGINDPFTAVLCVDRLGSGLRRLLSRQMPGTHFYDDEQTLRLVLQSIDFAGLLDEAFDQIRQNMRGSTAVAIRMLETLEMLAAAARRPDQREALRRHAEMIFRVASADVPEQADRDRVEQRYHSVLRALREA
jgi:uncharacterized membrane protein